MVRGKQHLKLAAILVALLLPGYMAAIAAPAPWVHLQEAQRLAVSMSGAAGPIAALQSGSAQPLSLATADFDEDGVPDLICGYATSTGGVVQVFRGNLYSIYPNAPGNDRQPKDAFLPDARVFSASVAPDFLGAGDFDGDGHADIVIASKTDSNLHWMNGDGKGSLASAPVVRLPGHVTAMVTGEINRRDGLNDVVVATSAGRQSLVSIFEGPIGASKATAETIALPGAATSMALGQFDRGFEMDLAIAAGKDLLTVTGRDRKLALNAQERATVPALSVTKQSFGAEIVSLAPGNFSSNGHQLAAVFMNGTITLLKNSPRGWESKPAGLSSFSNSVQLVATRTSASPGDDLLIVDSANRKFDIVNGAADQTVSLEGQPVAVLPMRLNKDAQDDLVVLREGSASPDVHLTAPAHIFVVNSTGTTNDCDGNDGVCSTDGDPDTSGCQPGVCTLQAAMTQSSASAGADEIDFSIATGYQVIHIPFGGWTGPAETVTFDATTQPGFAGTPIIEINGDDLVNGNDLYTQAGANNSVFRGFVFTHATNGLFFFSSNNIVEGNYFGTDATGTIAQANSNGITGGSNHTIGGTTAAARNIISGNSSIGIWAPGSGTVIQGNYIGTDVTGTSALGNSRQGIYLGSADNVTIGGTVAGAGNVISGNNTANSNPEGAVDTGGGSGILIQGNLIGTDVTGSVAMGDTKAGIYLNSVSTTIGGTTPSARNIISANGKHGITVASGFGDGDIIEGNYIGTNASGAAALPNTLNGVECSGKIVIGGTAAGAGNVISGNGQDGIGLDTGFGTTIQGNFIGTQADGVSALGNAGYGVARNTGNAVIGGTAPGEGNVIAFNGSAGIKTIWTTVITEGNSIHSNTGLGIDLDGDGVTPNANCTNTNYPVVTSAITDGTDLTVIGTLNSQSNRNFKIDFYANTSCDSSGFGEGARYLGTTTVTTDGSCNASFQVTIPGANVAVGESITTTSTPEDLGNSTSEFSQCVAAEDACIFCDDFNDQDFSTSFGPWVIKKGSWSAASGDAATTTSSASELLSPNFGGCTNCNFESTLKISQIGKMDFYGWYQDSSHYVQVRFLFNKSKIQIKQKSGSLISKAKVAATINPNTFYDVKVVYNGTNFQLSLDNVLLPGLTINKVATPTGNSKFWVKSTTGTPTTGTIASITVK